MAVQFNRSNILKQAWADYRRDEFKGYCGPRCGEGFNRKHFAYCLRMAWAAAKDRAARAAAIKPASAVTVCVNPARAAEIRAEIHDLEMGNFINWTRHAALGAELARLHA